MKKKLSYSLSCQHFFKSNVYQIYINSKTDNRLTNEWQKPLKFVVSLYSFDLTLYNRFVSSFSIWLMISAASIRVSIIWRFGSFLFELFTALSAPENEWLVNLFMVALLLAFASATACDFKVWLMCVVLRFVPEFWFPFTCDEQDEVDCTSSSSFYFQISFVL